MKVSVLMITYNHEAYVAQALDSALMQQVDFPFEIVIGEDGSTDRTSSIVLDYQRRFPERIRVLLREKNLGMMRNFMDTYHACQGSYVAILEGDDYWTAPDKLQKQVDFLDAHSDFAMVFHNVATVSEIAGIGERLLCEPGQPEVSSLEDLIRENFIPTVSVMFRHRLFGEFPAWFPTLKYGDWPLHMLNAHYGKIDYLPEVMAVYRIHAGGVSSGAIGNPERYLQNIEGIIEVYQRFNEFWAYRYDRLIRKRLPGYYLLAAKSCRRTGMLGPAVKYYAKYLLTFLPVACRGKQPRG